jgi:hypothetical protein
MSKSFSIEKDEIKITKDGKTKSYSLKTDSGACLKALIDKQGSVMKVSDILLVADNIFKSYGKDPIKDRGRAVRALLGREGLIEKRGKGKYIFTGNFGATNKSPFSATIKGQILKKAKYRCVNCGLSKALGAELMIDHILPESKGGKGTLENGMVLCATCNNKKSNYGVQTYGKKMFEQYLQISIRNSNGEDEVFFKEILKVFEKYKQE